MVKNNFQIQPTDITLLQHVALHKMTTHEVVAQLPEMNGISIESAKKRLQRLRKAGYLQSADLMEKRRYYHLSQQGAKYLNQPVRKEMHLKDGAKIRAYAGLLLCTDPRLHYEKKSTDDMALDFPELSGPSMRVDYYLNKSEPERTRLGFYKIDYSPASRRWSYTIPRIEAKISKLCNNDTYRDMLLNGLAEMTFITALQDKARALAAALQDADIPEPFTVKFYVIEDLLPLIAPQKK